MLEKSRLFYILLICNIAFLSLCVMIKASFLNVFLSFELGFFASFLIILSSFLAYKKKITQLAKVRQSSFKAPLLQIFIKKTPDFSKNIKFYALNDDLNLAQKTLIFTCFFAALKLLAYALFVLFFLMILRKNMLDIFALLAGVSTLLAGIFAFAFSLRFKR